VVASSAVDVGLRYRHEADAHWPFPFEVSQHFTLAPSTLRVQLQFTNLADIAQPVGLGWHPYFPKRARSRLHVELSDRWDSDAVQLPVRKLAQPGIDSDIAHLDFDNCFEGWAGPARIRDEKMALQMTSSMHRLVVYTPREKDYFCVEPVSHVSNAIHMADPAAHGLHGVAPGETVDEWMQLDIAMV
jgi:aldose 1-epimerase